MYTVLIKNDNTAIVTERQRVMQNSKLVDVLQILVPKTYNDLDMSKYVARLEYLTPINHNMGYVELEIADADYKNDYIAYRINIDTNLTAEVGDVQFMVTFIDVSMNDEGAVETTVRKTDTFKMTVIPIANWFVAPDSALSELDQRIIANQEAIKAVADLQSTAAASKLDDIKLDTESKKIYGMSDGKQKGEGISLTELGDALVDSNPEGLVHMNDYNDEVE